ncbi:MAG: hypothetical protein HDQ93_03395 [Desulfovibrio sp.]|nr:hypothetical protein [Desulfovibrio sp.]
MNYELADHLVTPRVAYTHHGLYAGGGEVLEYSRKGVNLTSLDDFSEGYGIYVETHLARRYSREESIQRGISRLGEDQYNLIFRNCERFVYWCIDGLPICSQIEGRIFGIIGEFAQGYINSRRLPPNVIELLTRNPFAARKLVSIFGNNASIFNILGPALSRSNLPGLSNLIPSTLGAGAAPALASSAGASAVVGLMGGAGAGVAGAIGGGMVGAGTIVAAPLVATAGAAVAVGYGVKKIIDYFSD